MENLGTKLPNDPSYWDDIILNELGKKSPALVSTVVATDIKESDYPNGNLTGLIVAANGKVLIPLVVRGFRMKPLDVIVYDNKILALTERTVSGTLFSPSVSSGRLANPQDLQISTDISRLLSPPDSTSGGFATPYNYSNKMACGRDALPGRLRVSEALKIASDATKDRFAVGLARNRLLLEKVATLLPFDGVLAELGKKAFAGNTDSIMERIKKIVHRNFGMQTKPITMETSFVNDLRFDSSDSVELIMKFEEIFGLNISDADAEKMRTVGDAVRYIEKHGTGRYKMAANLTSDDSLYIRAVGDAYSVNGVTKKASELTALPEDIKAALLLTGEALVAPEGPNADITILTKKGLKPLTSTTLANVVCREGDSLSGVFLPNVISFDHNLTRKGLFLSKDRQWIYQEHLTGSAIDVTHTHDPEMHSGNIVNSLIGYLKQYTETEDVPKIGEYGTFIKGSCKSEKVAIEPFKVVSLYNVSGSIVMSVAASSGQRLVVEYRKENIETIPNQRPLMVASGNLVSKYFPTDRVYIVGDPYRYVSLKAQRQGARTPEEALVIPSEREDGCVITIKKASGGYVISRDVPLGRLSRDPRGGGTSLLPSKLACQYELAQYGLGKKQAEILTNMSPVSFVMFQSPTSPKTGCSNDTTLPYLINSVNKKASVELPTRHSGAQLPESVPPSYPRLFTNNTEQFINQDTVNTAAMLDDPETINLLLTIGMGEIDSKVRQYVVSNLGDIHDLIDKLGRLLLIIRTSKDTGISESALSDLVQKLDRTAWELNDFSGRSQTTEDREGVF